MTSVAERISRLEAELAALKKVAGDHAEDKSVAPSVQAFEDRRGVSITQVVGERSDLPSLDEMKRLFAAVKHLAPGKLDDKYDPDKPFRGFCACFRWLQNQGRADQPNKKFSITYWTDACKSWLRQRGAIANDVDGNLLVLAVCASGDVAYVPHDGSLGHVWEFAIHEFANRGKPASTAWKGVMAGGPILSPSRPSRPMSQPSPVRAIGF
jgi:hypothetical protein